MECHNPGGTGKDRAALGMLREAERRGDLPPPLSAGEIVPPAHSSGPERRAAGRDDAKEEEEADPSPPPPPDPSPQQSRTTTTTTMDRTIETAARRSRTGGVVVEGTSGSTGISLASLCAARGHSVVIVMPDDQASEKRTMLECLGAVVHVVPNCAISNPNHYVNAARTIADAMNGGGGGGREPKTASGRTIRAAFMNQFENRANFDVHYTRTGKEIWDDAGGRIDAFVMSSGTGGTIAGAGRYLKERNPSIRVILVDPPGSALYNKVKHGVAYADQQRERALLRHRYDTLAEGIGLDRVTDNFSRGYDAGVLDDAVRVTDQEAVDVAHWLLREEGIFVGSSSAFNVAGAVETAMSSGPGCRVVTVICDSGQRHLTRFWNRDFVRGWGLEWPEDKAKDRRLPQCLRALAESTC
mmetsp:Transcript_7894/g.23341  ORF Transcript_7894/g.23341 Transcript_7894/m.23341 type:complete len:413 (-) Transcript_7894:501-1739(-)